MLAIAKSFIFDVFDGIWYFNFSKPRVVEAALANVFKSLWEDNLLQALASVERSFSNTRQLRVVFKEYCFQISALFERITLNSFNASSNMNSFNVGSLELRLTDSGLLISALVNSTV